ncbi:MAG: TIR domain-containing protein [Hyphomicrobiales bacterium]|nr:MAG: TIR domain-containing protein [Hyphomicrobiales bacterium]
MGWVLGKIFISHSSANNAEALAIHDWLAEQGWGDVFLDLDPKRGLVAGDRWQAALKAAAEQCELILILISPAWAKSKWCLAEFLLAKQMNKQILGVVVEATPIGDLPVELTAEWQLVDLSAPDTGWSVTISPPRYEPETTVNFSGTGLARLRTGLEKAGLDATTFHWPPAGDPTRAPYRGLLPLDHDDAGIFFGRDGAIVLTLDRLRGQREAAAPRFTTILGASGAGKSSFLRAGILPRLARDSRHFYVLPIIRPERAALSGEHGFAAMLDSALRARNIVRNRADIRDAVLAGANAVAPFLRDLAIPEDAGDGTAHSPPALVIAIDQAEELLSADNAEAGAFLTLLADLGRRDDPPIMVIFTVRSDSFDQLQSRPELAPTQPHQLVDLPPIPAGSFGDIIRGPARRMSAAGRKLHVDETLVDALLSDIEEGGTKDALPLMAFTLERLFTEYGADGDLQLAEYEKLGRIRGAIEAAVEQALLKADDNPAIPRDRAARLILLRRGLIPWLAGIDPNTGSPRRRVARLAEVPEEARPLIELMVEQRLLATDVDTATKERTIEPAHEALLRQWGALDGWLVEDTAALATIEALRRAASEWDANTRASEFIIHRGARLEATEQMATDAKFATYLTSIDSAYLSAARNLENSAIKKARAARTRWLSAAAIAGVVLVAGATAGYFTWSAGEAAKTQAAVNFEIARGEAALRDGRPEDAARAALTAYALSPSTNTRTAALTGAMAVSANSLGAFPFADRVVDTTWLAPGRLVVLTAKGEVTEIDVAARTTSNLAAIAATPLPIALAADMQGSAAVYRADASITGLDGATLLAPPQPAFAARAGAVVSGADGKLVAYTGLIGDMLVRDWRTLPAIDTLPNEPGALAIAFKPNGSKLVVLRPNGDLATYADIAAEPQVTASGITKATAMDLAHVIDYLAISSGAGEVTMLALANPTDRVTIKTGAKSNLVAWSPLEQLLAAPCGSNDVCVYGRGGALRQQMHGHKAPIASLRWSPDGLHLATSSSDGNVRLWSVAPDRHVSFELRADEPKPLAALAVDRATQRIAAGDASGTIWVWTGDEPAVRLPPPDELAGDRLSVASLAFLSDGRLAAVYLNRGVAVWSVERQATDRVTVLDNLSFSRVAALTGDIRAAVPLSDKTMLVFSGDELREARIAADTMPLDQWGVTAAPAANAAFVSYSDGTIRRRDLGTGAEGTVAFDASQSICGLAPTIDNNGAKSLDVSADGKWLVATRADSSVVVHSLADPAKPLCLALPAPDSKTVAFSPDSRRLAILSATDRLFVFDLAAPDSALIFDAPAVPVNSPLTDGAGAARTSSWLGWRDDNTLAIATAAGSVELIALDPAGWRTRVDSLSSAP